MIGLSVEFNPAPALSMFDRVLGAMRDLQPLYEQVLEPAFYEWQEERFASEGGDQKWERLSAGYAAWKARNFPGRTILVREGVMREGLTTRGGRYQVRRMDARELELGTSAPYAAYHQFGTGRMPRREIIPPTGSHVAKWQALGERYFERIAGEA